MSRQSSHEHFVKITDDTEILGVIREEQSSSEMSSVTYALEMGENLLSTECAASREEAQIIQEPIDRQRLETILEKKEEMLLKEFKQILQSQTNELKDRFDFILQNEQVRASYMLREAHRERQEKITALQTQLECKNLAGLMYVMCTERQKSKLQKLRLIEAYTGYIRYLQAILKDGQDLIMKLSRGFKTAARVDNEWRQKMGKILKEFQAYVNHFNGGPPETNQYLFDLPSLMKTEAAIHDDSEEDLTDYVNEEEEEASDTEDPIRNKQWFEEVEGDCRPFVVFGDMADFNPPQRRAVLNVVKAAKTAPKKWKNYVFNEMHLNSECSNADVIKDEYPRRVPPQECQKVVQTEPSKRSIISAHQDRMTTTSMDVRGNMGSLLKIITSIQTPTNRANLLAARDSMEIASTTKLRGQRSTRNFDPDKDKIYVGNRMASMMEQFDSEEEIDDEKDISRESKSMHKDSLQVIPAHLADKDRKIHYEKVCPMRKCQRVQMDSFVRSLPPYMRANPFTHFEQTYEDYEVCSPEQLEILRQRIEDKKKENVQAKTESDPLEEWTVEVAGVGVQTSDASLPPCKCKAPSPTPVSSVGRMFNVSNLYPIEQKFDEIRKECFYDGRIEFNRFKVVGHESSDNVNDVPIIEGFKKNRLEEVKGILKQHPSLLDIF